MSNTAERLREAMKIRGMRQVDICEKTGIVKSAVSQYLSGKVIPKQDKVFLLSEALSVSPAWLMGADVPMEKDANPYYLNAEAAKMAQELKDNPGQRMLFDASRDLSPADIEIVISLINGLKAKERRGD